jgi:hypothetical protein
MRKLNLAIAFLTSFAFSAAQAREPILLSAPATATTADRALVLVHGLMGDPRLTFGKIPQFIGSDDSELPGHGKMSDLAVYAVDYQADFTSRGSLEVVAKGVADDIAASTIFRRHRHIWFVTHSMGGLVLKRSLALWVLRQKMVLFDRVVGIGMLGVPSAGAPLAKLLSSGRFDEVATALGWNGGLVRDLSTDEGQRYLGSLETDWMAVKALRESGSIRKFTPQIVCGFETRPEFRIMELVLGSNYGTVVPDLFASSVCDDRRGFPASHSELPKPEDRDAPVYVWLRDLIIKSATASLQEQRDAMTTASPDVPSYLAGKVDRSNEELEGTNLDRMTGLPHEPERIEFIDDKSREIAEHLVLRGGPFYGSTKSELYEALSKKNTCIHLSLGANRLLIRLAVDGPTKTCRDGRSGLCKSIL